MTPKQKKQARIKKYNENPEKYNKSILAVSGGMLALIDHVEIANEVMPELFPDKLKYTIEDSINLLYSKKASVSVAEEHNQLANLFRVVIESIK